MLSPGFHTSMCCLHAGGSTFCSLPDLNTQAWVKSQGVFVLNLKKKLKKKEKPSPESSLPSTCLARCALLEMRHWEGSWCTAITGRHSNYSLFFNPSSIPDQKKKTKKETQTKKKAHQNKKTKPSVYYRVRCLNCRESSISYRAKRPNNWNAGIHQPVHTRLPHFWSASGKFLEGGTWQEMKAKAGKHQGSNHPGHLCLPQSSAARGLWWEREWGAAFRRDCLISLWLQMVAHVTESVICLKS